MMQTSLAIQWLGLGTFTARAQVQSLVGELISGKMPRMTKKKKERTMETVVATKVQLCSAHVKKVCISLHRGFLHHPRDKE